MINKKNNYSLILSVMTILLLSFSLTAAIGCDTSGWKGYSKLNENKTVCVTCPTCDYINISIINPDNTLLFQNQEMTNTNQEFCYTTNGTQNEQLGTYQINGFSQLDEPLGLCYDVTFSGKENNIWAYITGLTIVIAMLLGVIWLNRKFDSKERDRLYKKLVLGFVEAKNKNSKSDFGTMILYLIGYGILKMIFVLYYLVVILFLFIFKDFAVSFGLNTFALLAPELIIVSLYGLTLVGFYMMAQMYEIIKDIIKDTTDGMRGIFE